MRSRIASWAPVIGAAVLFAGAAALGDARTRGLFANTLLLAAGTCMLATPVSVLLAFLLARTNLACRSFFGVLTAILALTPLFLLTGGWQAAFGVAGWWSALTGGKALLTGWLGAIWVHVNAAIPWQTGIIGAGLWSVERELEEDALLLGSAWNASFRVTFRRAAPAIAAAIAFAFLQAAAEMTVTDFFLIRTFAEELYTETALGTEPGESPLLFAPSVMLAAAIVLVAVTLTLRLTPIVRRAVGRAPLVFPLGRARGWATAIVAAIMVCMLAVPVASLLWKSGVLVTQTSAGYERSWSAAKCVTMIAISPARHGEYLLVSMAAAASAATVAVVAGGWLGWIARPGGLRAAPAVIAIVLGLGLPAPLIGIAVIQLMNQPNVPWLVELYDNSIAPLVAAQSLRALPVATWILWHAFRSIPQELLESARLDGAKGWRQLTRVAVPQRRNAILMAWLIAGVFAFGELGASILVAPPGMIPATIHLFNLLHFGVEDQVAAFCLAVWGIVAVVGIVLYVAAARRRGVSDWR